MGKLMKVGGKRMKKFGGAKMGGGRGGIARKRDGHIAGRTPHGRVAGSRDGTSGLSHARFAPAARHRGGSAQKGERVGAITAESNSGEYNKNKNMRGEEHDGGGGGIPLDEQYGQLNTTDGFMGQPAMMHHNQPQMEPKDGTTQVSQQSSEVEQLQQSSMSLRPPPRSRQQWPRKSSVGPLGEQLVSGVIIGRFGARWWPPAPAAADQEGTKGARNIEHDNTKDNENDESEEAQ